MNVLSKTFWDMVKACISFARDNESEWAGIPFIKKDFDILVVKEKDLSEAAIVQTESDTEGLVAQKNQDLQTLSKDFYRMNRSLCHLAKSTNNQVLLKAVDIPESRMLEGSLQEVIIRFKAMLAIAREKLPELANYPVTDQSLTELETRVKTINEMPDIISVQSSHRKMASRNIKDVIGEARVILDLLDDGFEAVITNEKFLDGWFEARKIKGRHRRKNNGNGEGNNDGSAVDE